MRALIASFLLIACVSSSAHPQVAEVVAYSVRDGTTYIAGHGLIRGEVFTTPVIVSGAEYLSIVDSTFRAGLEVRGAKRVVFLSVQLYGDMRVTK